MAILKSERLLCSSLPISGRITVPTFQLTQKQRWRGCSCVLKWKLEKAREVIVSYLTQYYSWQWPVQHRLSFCSISPAVGWGWEKIIFLCLFWICCLIIFLDAPSPFSWCEEQWIISDLSVLLMATIAFPSVDF